MYGWVGYYHSVPPRDDVKAEDLAAAWYLPRGEKPFPGIILGTDLCAQRKDDASYDRFYCRGDKVQLTFVPFRERR